MTGYLFLTIFFGLIIVGATINSIIKNIYPLELSKFDVIDNELDRLHRETPNTDMLVPQWVQNEIKTLNQFLIGE